LNIQAKLISKEFVMSDVATYPLRLPRSLKAGIERVSKRDGTSVNQFVAMAAAKKLATLEAEDFFRSRIKQADLAAFDRIMARTSGQPPRVGDEC
jgi:hypothetical protein